jgi:PhnB protein
MNTHINLPAMSPYLTVQNADKAIEFYKAAFGATELYRLTDSESRKIVHAEILINGSHIMLADENPAFHNKSPRTLGGTSVKLCLMVENTDAAVARAGTSGATIDMPPGDMFYGFRCAALSDPFGHQWLIQHEIEKVAPDEMQRRWDAMVKAGTSCKPSDK